MAAGHPVGRRLARDWASWGASGGGAS
jgi:hypothetical protein